MIGEFSNPPPYFGGLTIEAYPAGGKIDASCRCMAKQAITRYLVEKKLPRPLNGLTY